MSASQTSSVLGRRLRRLFTKDEPLPRMSRSWSSFMGVAADFSRHLSGLHGTDRRFDPLSIPAVAALLARPERAEGAVRSFEEIFALLVRASHVPGAGGDRLDPMLGEELTDLPLDLRARRDIGRHPAPDDRLGGRR